MEIASLVSFVVGTLGVAYTFAGYPLHAALRAKLQRSSRSPVPSSSLPGVTVVLVAYNEGARIRSRVENLLAAEYPPEYLHVLVVSDGSTDDTAEQLQHEARVSVLQQPQRSGKPSGLNLGVATAKTELIVFTDARQHFDPGAIRALAERFADPAVGAVSGALEIAPAASNTGGGVDAYWKLEKWIRASESQVDSAIGCTGAIYAIRRALFRPIPTDTLLDDVVIPMQIALSGHRVLFEPRAVAWDPQPLEPAAEQRRKRRTLAGNFQMLFRYPGWLLPWRNRLWWPLIAHKYLRLLAPLFLLAAWIGNAGLLGSPIFRLLFAGQCTLYLIAAAAPWLPKSKLVSLPAGFVFLNLMSVRAFWHYVTSPDLQRWETAPKPTEAPPTESSH